MPTISAPVDENGNITVPAESGLTVPIREQDNQVPPQPVNISSVPIKFLVRGRIEKMLSADPGYAQGKLLTLTEAEADQLSSSWLSFQVLDMTNSASPVTLWSGKIRRGT